MLESLYITLTLLAFSMIFLSFVVQKDKLMQQITLLGIALSLFAALAMASANVEIITCTSVSCVSASFLYEENMYIFGFFALFTGVLFFIKAFDGFYFAKRRL